MLVWAEATLEQSGSPQQERLLSYWSVSLSHVTDLMTDLSNRKSLHKDFLECKSSRGITTALSQDTSLSLSFLWIQIMKDPFFILLQLAVTEKECMLIISGLFLKHISSYICIYFHSRVKLSIVSFQHLVTIKC